MRVCRGLYAPIPLDAISPREWREDPWVIAVKLFGPDYYIGGVDGVRALELIGGSFRSRKEGGAMEERLLRRREVEKITGMSRSSIYRLMPDGEFPRPVKVGPAAVRWRESDITARVESRPVADGDSGPPNAA